MNLVKILVLTHPNTCWGVLDIAITLENPARINARDAACHEHRGAGTEAGLLETFKPPIKILVPTRPDTCWGVWDIAKKPYTTLLKSMLAMRPVTDTAEPALRLDC